MKNTNEGTVKGGQASPPGNTGALNTSSGGVACGGVVVDWLSGTCLGDYTLSEGLEIVSGLFGAITELEYGFRGYKCSGLILAGRGRVAWDFDRPEMGVHVDLSSQGLAEWSRQEGSDDIRGLLQWMSNMGFRFSRLDIAIDDKSGLCDMAALWSSVRSGDYTSRWSVASIRNIEGVNPGSGRTISFGSRKSDTYLRVYDKAAKEKVDGHWVRFELELKRKRAHAMALALVADGASAAVGVMRGYIEFKTPDVTENKSRWAIAGWWLALLDGASKVRLVVPKVKRTLESMRRWLDRQVAPALGLMLRADEGCFDFLDSLCMSGAKRLKSHHLVLLQSEQCICVG